MLVRPAGKTGARRVLVKGPNIMSLPDFEPLGESISGPVLLKVGDNVSTDEILPAGREGLALPQQHPGDQSIRVRADR